MQVDGFRHHWEYLQENNIDLIEISCDPIPSQKAFSNMLAGIPFPMGSDFHPRGLISRQFGVYNEEKGNSKIKISINKEKKNYLFELSDKRKFDYETLKLLNKEHYIKKISV